MVTPTTKPAYVSALEAVFGPPSEAGFGSAVFYAQSGASGDLEGTARAAYQRFTGDLWERYGPDAWLGAWKQVYTRPPGAVPAIVTELRALEDRGARQAAGVLVDDADDPQAVQAAASAAFDEPAVTDLAVYTIGDGAALAGILITARRAPSGEQVTVVFLLD